MKHRKLRIAWSVAWGVVAVLLCVLWVRSYSWADSIGIIASVQGTVGIVIEYPSGVPSSRTPPWNHFQTPIDEVRAELAKSNESLPSPIYGGLLKIRRVVFVVPDWLVLVLVMLVGILPWYYLVRWRFSLRTLLIATTLVAVALGLIVWASR